MIANVSSSELHQGTFEMAFSLFGRLPLFSLLAARSLDVTSTAANDPIDETKITTEKVDQVVDSALTAGDDRIASFSNGA